MLKRYVGWLVLGFMVLGFVACSDAPQTIATAPTTTSTSTATPTVILTVTLAPTPKHFVPDPGDPSENHHPVIAFPSATRDGPPPMPPYPNVVSTPTVEEPDDYRGKHVIIRFQTADAPQQVITFYREHLLQQGWFFPRQDNEVLLLANQEACPFYNLRLTATHSETITNVSIDVVPGLCIQPP